jgi:1-acyl-sn-glycerol-3-phosphate acyltransferase
VETREQRPPARGELVARINRLAVDLIGLPIDEVVLVPPRTVLKTSSGKIRRAACREAYEHGKLSAAGRAPWLQLARLALRGFVTQCSRRARRLATFLWGARALLVAGCLAPLLWVALLLIPGLMRRRRTAVAFVQFGRRLAGISLRIQEPERPAFGRRVYVSNHASYLDVLAVIAALPLEVTFVAKREFSDSRLLGLPFKRLGCIFVERQDVHEAVVGAGELQERLSAHESLHMFAEGTFRRDPGLMPFHMGAFLAATNTGAAVIPVAVCGTRSMLPDGALLPQPTPIEVIIGEPLMPAGGGWHEAVKLRSAARAHILSHIHEPDLEQRPI